MKNLDNTLTKHLVNYVQEYFDDMEEEMFACGGMREDDRLDLYWNFAARRTAYSLRWFVLLVEKLNGWALQWMRSDESIRQGEGSEDH